MLIPNFETLLPRLVSTYEQGRLVPFVGSGMSRRACTDWPTFIASLEVSAGLHGLPALDGSTTREVLVRRANNAVRTLKRAVPGVFAKAVRAALLSNEPNTPLVSPQMRSLTGIWWPLVLSTNYDNCYAAGFHGNKNFAGRQLAVVGRGAVDCQRVLTSLSTAGRSLLWALQGYLSDLPCADLPPLVSPSPEDRPQLEEQLVVGHEEYRRVTYRDLHFRRAFAEVFRQRSLLFLGAGLQESYLQELFGEVLEFYGPAARPHYAFVQKGEVDPAFMLARFQIVVIEYREHAEVQQWLDRLAEQVSQPHRTPVAWCWGRIDRSGRHWKSVPDLEVVRGPLPAKPKRSECLAVSAGGSGDRFYFSAGIQELMEAWGVPKPPKPSAVVPPYLSESAIGLYLAFAPVQKTTGATYRASTMPRLRCSSMSRSATDASACSFCRPAAKISSTRRCRSSSYVTFPSASRSSRPCELGPRGGRGIPGTRAGWYCMSCWIPCIRTLPVAALTCSSL